MDNARWKIGDKIWFDGGDEIAYGTIEEVTEIPQRDVVYRVKWDDGFDDGDNTFAEWELNDPEDLNAIGA